MTIRWLPVLRLLGLTLLVWTSCEDGGGKKFSGSYSGDGVGLEIKGAGPQHQGQLEVGGKTYPVEATASGAELKGHFGEGDERFELVAKFSGDTLELVSGGKTYRLTKAASKNPLAGGDKQGANPLGGSDAPGEPMTRGARGFSGNYSGDIQGVATALKLDAESGALSGVIDSGGYKYNLKGKISDKNAEGTLTDPQAGGAQMTFKAKLDGDNLVLTMVVPGSPGLDIAFRRGTSAPSTNKQATAGTESGVTRDPNLVGTWSQTTSMSGGGVGMAWKEYLRITADGRFQLGTGKAAGGGADWGMESGDGIEIKAQGKWKTEGQTVHANEGAGWQPFARYYIEGNKLMFTFGDGSRQIWYR